MNKKTKQSSSWYSINKAPNTTNKENWYTIKPVSVQPMSARLVSVRNLEENEKSNEIIRHTDEPSAHRLNRYRLYGVPVFFICGIGCLIY